MIVDAYSLLFLFTIGILIFIILALFVQRQIFRMRDNSVRREANITVGAGLSKRKKEELNQGIEAVRQFQLLRAPKFTEIGTIAEHANAPYINRMIAMDELREIERQLEFINSDLERLAGESMYAYLMRIRFVALPSLSVNLIERIGSLAEHCRYRSEHFREKELAETRALIKEVVKILNNEQERLSALDLKGTDGFTSAIPATFQGLSKKLTPGEGRKSTRKRIMADTTENRSANTEAKAEKKPEQAYSNGQGLPLMGSNKDGKEEGDSTPKGSVSRIRKKDSRQCLPSEKDVLIKPSAL